MQVNLLTLAGLLISAVSPAVSASLPTDRIPVALRLTGDDGLTQTLRVGLEHALQKDSLLRLGTRGDRDVISIESDSNVGWDKLSGRTVVIYTVYIFRGGSRGTPHTGICYENGISKCVSAIVRLARIQAEFP